MSMSLKSLVIISIIMCVGLIYSTMYLSDSIGETSNNPAQYYSQNTPKIDVSPFDQVSSRQTLPDNIEFTDKNIAPEQFTHSNSPVSTVDNPPEPHIMNMIANLVVNYLAQDKNDFASINSESTNSKEISQDITDISSLNFAISETNGTDYYELLKEVPMTEEQTKKVQIYSGGKSPTEIINEFCIEVRNGELHLMAEDIRQSYNYNPASPAILMSVFEKMGNLCP
jgi:hypothetical protein